MAVEIALVSDTHVPSRAPSIPAWVEGRLRDADHVVHAGDFDTAEAFERVVTLARELTAVRGNTDRVTDLPEVATVERGGVTFVVTHGAGSRRGYERRVANTVRSHGGPDAVGVSGHTHEPMDERVEGVRLLNPGSATGAAPASEPTMAVATVADGDLTVEFHRG
ncbi:MAG: metallophosphoesterase family protein [Haloferacaceae archaeon]